MEKYIVRLEKNERENLLSLIKKGKSSARKLMHARILLETDEKEDHYQRGAEHFSDIKLLSESPQKLYPAINNPIGYLPLQHVFVKHCARLHASIAFFDFVYDDH